jgi:hypothetical protein
MATDAEYQNRIIQRNQALGFRYWCGSRTLTQTSRSTRRDRRHAHATIAAVPKSTTFLRRARRARRVWRAESSYLFGAQALSYVPLVFSLTQSIVVHPPVFSLWS